MFSALNQNENHNAIIGYCLRYDEYTKRLDCEKTTQYFRLKDILLLPTCTIYNDDTPIYEY